MNKIQNKAKVRTQKKKLRKIKKKFSSDESITLEQSEPDSENEEEFRQQVFKAIENEEKDEEERQNIVEENVNTGVWVLIQGNGKPAKKHWIGQVLSIDAAGDPTIKFLKKQEKYGSNKPYFIWCPSEGSVVDQGYVIKVFPEPNFTPRGWLIIPVSFGTEYNIQ